MVFFGAAELPFDGFFALFVFCFSLGGVAVVFRDVQGVLPEVASDGFLMVFAGGATVKGRTCLLYTSPSPRDVEESRMPSSA